jgi:hypothetical protein
MNDAANAIDKQIKLIPTNNLLCFKNRIAELKKFLNIVKYLISKSNQPNHKCITNILVIQLNN